ncbi:MAG: ureidoglycolate lyase [Paracoccaceae bacterium]
MRQVLVEPMKAEAFAPFGEVIELKAAPDRLINQGLCGRHHDLARLDFTDGRAGISLFAAEARSLPYKLEMMERHPAGSQAFIPMTMEPFLVIVAPDESGAPGAPRAFLTAPGTGVNFAAGVWHGVLTPLAEPGLFAVIDRIGAGANLEEHWLDEPWEVIT